MIGFLIGVVVTLVVVAAIIWYLVKHPEFWVTLPW
jgi:hypothetical protein